jgi:hypothetical protein
VGFADHKDAHGPQQINNTSPRAENETAQNEVIDGVTHEPMDAGTPGAAGRSRKALETVGAIHRAANR